MFTRRLFQFSLIFLQIGATLKASSAQQDGMVTVRIRADESMRALIPPIAQSNLTIEPDQSDDARNLAMRSPPGRTLPIILIIVGAIAIAELAQIIKEMLRQFYYGGVVIDVRSRPPKILNDPKIPANMVFVIDSSGKTNRYTSDQFSLDTLKSALELK